MDAYTTPARHTIPAAAARRTNNVASGSCLNRNRIALSSIADVLYVSLRRQHLNGDSTSKLQRDSQLTSDRRYFHFHRNFCPRLYDSVDGRPAVQPCRHGNSPGRQPLFLGCPGRRQPVSRSLQKQSAPQRMPRCAARSTAQLLHAEGGIAVLSPDAARAQSAATGRPPNLRQPVDGFPFPGGELNWPDQFGLGAGIAGSYFIGKKFSATIAGSYFCAHLIADTYMHMGLLPTAPLPPNGYSPADFDGSGSELPLIGVALTPVVPVNFDLATQAAPAATSA